MRSICRAGWTFTQRIDLPVYYTNKIGPDNPTAGGRSGIGDWFIEEIVHSPEVSKNLRLFGSVRFVFPTGGGRRSDATSTSGRPREVRPTAVPDHKITIRPDSRATS